MAYYGKILKGEHQGIGMICNACLEGLEGMNVIIMDHPVYLDDPCIVCELCVRDYIDSQKALRLETDFFSNRNSNKKKSS